MDIPQKVVRGVAENGEAAPKEDDTFLDELPEQEHVTGTLEIYKPKCLDCGHLIPFLEFKYTKCHHTAGNEFCPAAEIRILPRVPVEDIVVRFIAAERAGDSVRLGKLYAHLGTKQSWYQERVQKALKEARKAQGLS